MEAEPRLAFTSGELSIAVNGTTVKLYYIKETNPAFIRLVNLTEATYPEGKKIAYTNYYGVNASFFRKELDESERVWACLNNIAYQDGKPVGALGSGTYNKQFCGTGVIIYNGSSRVSFSSSVSNPPVGLIPTAKGSWAQGGMVLFLGYTDWETRFKKDQYSIGEAGKDYLKVDDPRVAMVANVKTNEIYFFKSRASISIKKFRAAIMKHLAIAEGSGDTTPWAGIMLDGGNSAQYKNSSFYSPEPALVKQVPQIISAV